jgi:hypothetical protein
MSGILLVLRLLAAPPGVGKRHDREGPASATLPARGEILWEERDE